MEYVFKKFCAFGAGKRGDATMDNAKFSKFARECKLVNKKCSRTDIDLIFTRIKTKGQRKINFKTFMKGLQEIADKRGISLDDLQDKILKTGGPKSNSSTPRGKNVRFHDDKDAYTGVHRHGGPTTIDNTITLSNLADRSAADIRGRKIAAPEEDDEEMMPPKPGKCKKKPRASTGPGLYTRGKNKKKKSKDLARLKKQLSVSLQTIEQLNADMKIKDEKLRKSQATEIKLRDTIRGLEDENENLKEQIKYSGITSTDSSEQLVANAQKIIAQLKKRLRKCKRTAEEKERQLNIKVDVLKSNSASQTKEIALLKVHLKAALELKTSLDDDGVGGDSDDYDDAEKSDDDSDYEDDYSALVLHEEAAAAGVEAAVPPAVPEVAGGGGADEEDEDDDFLEF